MCLVDCDLADGQLASQFEGKLAEDFDLEGLPLQAAGESVITKGNMFGGYSLFLEVLGLRGGKEHLLYNVCKQGEWKFDWKTIQAADENLTGQVQVCLLSRPCE